MCKAAYTTILYLLGILLLWLAPKAAQASVSCAKHPIYCRIVRLQPSTNRSFAMELSNSLYRWSKFYALDPRISIAIAMQESSLRNIDRYTTVLTKEGKTVRGVSDVGVFQIHIATAKEFGIEVLRLRSDLDYQVRQHMKVLRRKISTCSQHRVRLKVAKGDEWTCYHSYTYHYRMRYKKMVGRYL